MRDNRVTVEAYAQAVAAKEWSKVAELLHPDYVGEYPQSGERIRGRDAFVQIYSRYEGELPGGEVIDIEGDDTSVDVSSPIPFGMPIVTVRGGGETFTVLARAHYPDGEMYHVVSLLHVVDCQIRRETIFWAAPFDAPAWRAPYVERMED